jgi:hypothetical protein
MSTGILYPGKKEIKMNRLTFICLILTFVMVPMKLQAHYERDCSYEWIDRDYGYVKASCGDVEIDVTERVVVRTPYKVYVREYYDYGESIPTNFHVGFGFHIDNAFFSLSIGDGYFYYKPSYRYNHRLYDKRRHYDRNRYYGRKYRRELYIDRAWHELLDDHSDSYTKGHKRYKGRHYDNTVWKKGVYGKKHIKTHRKRGSLSAGKRWRKAKTYGSHERPVKRSRTKHFYSWKKR